MEVRVLSSAPSRKSIALDTLVDFLNTLAGKIATVIATVVTVFAGAPAILRFAFGAHKPHLSIRVNRITEKAARSVTATIHQDNSISHFVHLKVTNRSWFATTATNVKVLLADIKLVSANGSEKELISYPIQTAWAPSEEMAESRELPPGAFALADLIKLSENSTLKLTPFKGQRLPFKFDIKTTELNGARIQFQVIAICDEASSKTLSFEIAVPDKWYKERSEMVKSLRLRRKFLGRYCLPYIRN